jgi:N6-L-threonylcarbamoyladenine synthase
MILGIESSCDETAIAVFDPQLGIKGEWIRSQIALHGRHGGVVPDLASREHVKELGPLIELSKAQWKPGQLDQIAVTYGPGLAPCLALGVAAAKALALALKIPVVGVNHLRGHIWSVFIDKHFSDPIRFDESLSHILPHLSLIVSGGHTILCRINKDRTIEFLSSTRDDAAGEALDKGAKLLGLGYPGGPLIEKHALGGKSNAFDFPRGLGRKSELEFSFSGLKTSLRYTLEAMDKSAVEQQIGDLCASYQQAVVDALARKTRAALQLSDYRSLGLSGGVANNKLLRQLMESEAKRKQIPFFPARPEHTGDNAAMIAFAAYVDKAALTLDGFALKIEPGLGL